MPETPRRVDPKLRQRALAQVRRGDKTGEPGKWSARKAQLATDAYKRAGGGYRGKRDSEIHLARWTAEDWGTRSGARTRDTGERHLQKAARDSLTEAEHAETTAKKRADRAAGRQHSPQPGASSDPTKSFGRIKMLAKTTS